MAIEIDDATVGKQVQAHTHIAPATIGAQPMTLVPAAANHRGALVEVGFYNSDAETRTVTIADGATTFRELHIAADGVIEVWLDDSRNLTWTGAENAAITATASAADVVRVTGGRYYYRAASQ